MPPPPEPKKSKDYSSVEMKKKSDKDLSKSPVILRNFDLVANLPARTEESEDEYEALDDNIIEQVQQKNEISRVDSKQSLHNGRQGSIESVYKPPSAASYEEEEDYEIYESITEAVSFQRLLQLLQNLDYLLNYACCISRRIMIT